MSDDARPTPEQMLQRVRAEETASGAASKRGRLKLFFGYAAGVGKTYAMLQAARQQSAEGRDVVVGYVEPHSRPETQALLEGLECLPTLDLEYRGARLREFNLDGALERKPELILVDELAHTNVAGSRHIKRWQDVEELLDAGIDVYSTVNVQHIESLNDIVAQISGVVVRETVPDSVFESAADVVLVDLPPAELLERLRQGKIYVPRQAAQALERFFRRENLVALREIALRQTAERIHEDVEAARLGTAAKVPWPTNERLLVCVGPSPTSAKVIRAAKRLADRLDAPWTAVHVAAESSPLSTAESDQIHRHLQLAERLGADVARLTGDDIAAELLAYAERRNVTKIVIGKTVQPPAWRWTRRKAFVDRLVEHSGDIDMLIVRGVDEPVRTARLGEPSSPGWRGWWGAALSLAAATAAALAFHAWRFSEANLVMIYLLAVVFSAVRFGKAPAIATSLAAVLLFDLLFTEPFYGITVYDSQYLITFAVMLAVGLTASTLMARVRRQADVARGNERRTEALYRLTKRLAALADRRKLVEDAEQTIAEVFDAYAVIFLPDTQGKILPVLGDLHLFAASAAEFAAAQWVYDHDEPAGKGTDTLPSAGALYLPLSTPNGVMGVLAVQPEKSSHFNDQRHLLDTFASHVALAVERSRLTEQAEQARLTAETERLRSSLLSAVSHDLRTPLAGIAGASSTLAASYDALDPTTRHDLLTMMNDEAERLSQLVESLLHMTRLSSGKVAIDRQWHPLDDIIGSTLTRLERQLAHRQVQIELDDALPLAQVDAVLIEVLLVNLIDNAIKYSGPDAPIEIHGRRSGRGILLEVADRGRGFPPGEEQRVFDLFYRGSDTGGDRRGTGIGLAICRAIAEAHGGRIEAENRPQGGALVRVWLPSDEPPPTLSEPNPHLGRL